MPSDSPDRIDEIVAFCRVRPGKRCRLERHDPAWAGDPVVPKSERRAFAEKLLSQDVTALSAAQERLYAADTWAVLLVFQAMDAAGKDGAIKHVMSGVNPQGCQVYSFKQPTSEELDHTFLWRCMKALPERGRIGIFNRSYYEDVLVARVHPQVVAAQRLPDAKPKRKSFWGARYDDINAFERHLDRNGTLVLKFFLNVSKDEQRKRFLDRIEDPAKHWKFSSADLAERGYWDDYQRAYEQMLSHTSTPWAPWYVIPADHKWVSRALVANLIVRALDDLKLEFPAVSPEKKAQIEAARAQLESE
jgi:PPK2 family polyphosphate:nucleotide phosphotransferase